MAASTAPVRIAILGAGAGGLCAGAQLRRAGITSFTIFDKGDGVGGTWRDNTYPGAACDVPSHLYSFSFRPNPRWSRSFAGQAEILAYLEAVADEEGLRPHLRLGTEVLGAQWLDEAEEWLVQLPDGEAETFDVVIAACGQLNRPSTPPLPGLDDFAGASFHSARWAHDVDLEGMRVGVVGSGASAIQLVPEVAKVAGSTTVFQRSPPWLVPRPDGPYRTSTQRRFARWPWLAKLHRWAIYARLEATYTAFRGGRGNKIAERGSRAFLAASVRDEALRDTLTPDYPVGCKRLLISNDWYPALQRDDVTVVGEAVAEVLPDGVVDAAGERHDLDALIFCTGFEATSFLAPMAITGRGGRPLTDAWADGAQAYLGVAAPDFPNLFMLYGPNTNLAHNSILFMLECQVRLVVSLVQALADEDLAYVEPHRDAMVAFDREVQRRLGAMVWSAGCASWYVNEDGRVTNNWPGHTYEYWWRTRRADLASWARVPHRSGDHRGADSLT